MQLRLTAKQKFGGKGILSSIKYMVIILFKWFLEQIKSSSSFYLVIHLPRFPLLLNAIMLIFIFQKCNIMLQGNSEN